jgi:transposase
MRFKPSTHQVGEEERMSLRPGTISPVPEMTVTVARAAFPHGNTYIAMRDTLGTLFSDQDFVDLFSTRGQPAYPPWRLALTTIMQFAEGLSDRQTADAVRARIDWKYALGLELSDAGFDFSLLSEFRTRLLDSDAEQLLLTTLLTRCKERGLLKTRGQQRTDATYVLAAIRALNRLECIGETMRAALNCVATAEPRWLEQHLDPQWAERYQQRVQDYRLPKSKAERVRYAEVIGADGFALLRAVYAPTAPVELRTLGAVDLLRRIWIQQFDAPCESVRWRDNAELPPAAILIQSPYDTDVHFGIKRATTWTGYKVHLTETCDADAPPLITNVETTTATVTDNDVVDDIHKRLAARELLPTHHIVDAGYMDAQQIVVARATHGVDMVGPMHQDTNWQARQNRGYAAADFDVDWAKQTVRCPQGQQSSYWRAYHDHTGHDVVDVRWSWKTCKVCPALGDCSQKQQGSRTLKLRAEAEYRALQFARQRQTTEAFREQYSLRAGCEGTLSQCIRSSGLRQARYRGLAKTNLQQLCIATARNVVRVIEWLTPSTERQPHMSRFSALLAAT